MREIKFRAWCEGSHDNLTFTSSQMEYDVTIQNGHYASVEGGWDIQIMCPTVPIMQFTGFTDANGVEVYEGDVVEDTFIKEKYVIYWNDNDAMFMMRATDGDGGNNICKADEIQLKVIGNIYENKELIE